LVESVSWKVTSVMMPEGRRTWAGTKRSACIVRSKIRHQNMGCRFEVRQALQFIESVARLGAASALQPWQGLQKGAPRSPMPPQSARHSSVVLSLVRTVPLASTQVMDVTISH
jgi:hypothetical protein